MVGSPGAAQERPCEQARRPARSSFPVGCPYARERLSEAHIATAPLPACTAAGLPGRGELFVLGGWETGESVVSESPRPERCSHPFTRSQVFEELKSITACFHQHSLP